MRALFVFDHAAIGWLAPALRLLDERGHSVHLAFRRVKVGESLEDVERLVAGSARITAGELPPGVGSPRGRLARSLRSGIDYLRYLEPRYRDAAKLRARARERAPSFVVRAGAIAGVAGTPPVVALRRTLQLVERCVLPPAQNGVLDLGTLQLEHGIVLMGRVVDADSRPLANVHLLTSSRHGPYAGRKTVSQADGTFEFAPMSPGTFTLTPEATLRDAEGNKRSRDVQAVFVQQEVMLAETDDVVELTVQAVPHVELEFEWVDRRAVKGQSVSYYGEFAVDGRMPREGAKPVWWRGVTEKVARDGKEFLVVKVPREAIELTLTLPADQRVTASYADGETKSGPGRVPLGDVTQAKRRVIYGDEPRAGQ